MAAEMAAAACTFFLDDRDDRVARLSQEEATAEVAAIILREARRNKGRPYPEYWAIRGPIQDLAGRIAGAIDDKIEKRIRALYAGDAPSVPTANLFTDERLPRTLAKVVRARRDTVMEAVMKLIKGGKPVYIQVINFGNRGDHATEVLIREARPLLADDQLKLEELNPRIFDANTDLADEGLLLDHTKVAAALPYKGGFVLLELGFNVWHVLGADSKRFQLPATGSLARMGQTDSDIGRVDLMLSTVAYAERKAVHHTLRMEAMTAILEAVNKLGGYPCEEKLKPNASASLVDFCLNLSYPDATRAPAKRKAETQVAKDDDC